jgi:acetoin utilization protein AcuB
MTAAELINKNLPVLSPGDLVSSAIALMDEFKISHLPLVENDVYLGLFSELFLLELDEADTLSKHSEALVRPFVYVDQHLFDALKLMDTFKISLIPVLGKDDKFAGSFTESSLAESITNLTAVQQPGGIIVLEMNPADYTLGQIAQIVESNDARILACYLAPQKDSNKIEVTLKVNREDLSAILPAFIRYNYTVKATFHHSDNDEDMRRRFELFMNYINM